MVSIPMQPVSILEYSTRSKEEVRQFVESSRPQSLGTTMMPEREELDEVFGRE